jgi:hypothetical protein
LGFGGEERGGGAVPSQARRRLRSLARGGAFLSLPRSLLGFLVAGWTVDAHRMWGLVGQIGATANFGGRQNLYILKSCTTLLGLVAMPFFFPAIWSISVYVSSPAVCA